jgi:hypothetical protein
VDGVGGQIIDLVGVRFGGCSRSVLLHLLSQLRQHIEGVWRDSMVVGAR